MNLEIGHLSRFGQSPLASLYNVGCYLGRIYHDGSVRKRVSDDGRLYIHLHAYQCVMHCCMWDINSRSGLGHDCKYWYAVLNGAGN